MTATRILISGASIAGPALAFWLTHYGFEVTVVEKSREVRAGGQAVDFKGPIHLTVLRRMGILDAVSRASVIEGDGLIVNANGRKIGVVPGAFAGGELNIPRGDLAGILYELSRHSSTYRFGDSITSLTETKTGVDVTFINAPPETFDLVIGADGIHSNVRSLAFGPEADYVRHLGHSYALVGIDGGADDVMYNEPGRMASLGGSKAPAFFVFASERHERTEDDVDAQKREMTEAYRGGAWRIPELVARIPDAAEFHMDSISRVTMDRYTTGRVALVGDSAYGNALGGFGTGLAIVGAYVLAGELHRADGDHTVGFQEYESKFRGYASVSQKVNAGRLLAPATRFGIRARNLMFQALALFGPLMKIIDRPATNIRLEDYDRPA